jgi:hypothetical protein
MLNPRQPADLKYHPEGRLIIASDVGCMKKGVNIEFAIRNPVTIA